MGEYSVCRWCDKPIIEWDGRWLGRYSSTSVYTKCENAPGFLTGHAPDGLTIKARVLDLVGIVQELEQ